MALTLIAHVDQVHQQVRRHVEVQVEERLHHLVRRDLAAAVLVQRPKRLPHLAAVAAVERVLDEDVDAAELRVGDLRRAHRGARAHRPLAHRAHRPLLRPERRLALGDDTGSLALLLLTLLQERLDDGLTLGRSLPLLLGARLHLLLLALVLHLHKGLALRAAEHLTHLRLPHDPVGELRAGLDAHVARAHAARAHPARGVQWTGKLFGGKVDAPRCRYRRTLSCALLNPG